MSIDMHNVHQIELEWQYTDLLQCKHWCTDTSETNRCANGSWIFSQSATRKDHPNLGPRKIAFALYTTHQLDMTTEKHHKIQPAK